jgi:hypothetical protein
MKLTVQLHASAALPPVIEPQISVGYEAEWDPEPIWILCRRENCPPFTCGIRIFVKKYKSFLIYLVTAMFTNSNFSI